MSKLKYSHDLYNFLNIPAKEEIIQINADVSNGYYSQWSQDYYVDKLYFKGMRNGIFADIGAAGGIDINNTYYFEKHLGWNGICIEPIPKQYDSLRKSRNCLCYNACCYERDQIVDFTYTEGLDVLSGITDQYDKRHLERINNDKNMYNVNVPNKFIKCLGIPLQWFFDASNYKIIDFVSIDVEGGEFSVIKGIDFDKTHINVICFEDNYHDVSLPIMEYLCEKGFLVVGRIGGDILMVNQKLMFSNNN